MRSRNRPDKRRYCAAILRPQPVGAIQSGQPQQLEARASRLASPLSRTWRSNRGRILQLPLPTQLATSGHLWSLLYLQCSGNRQRELHWVEAGDSTPKDGAPSFDGYPDIAQCTVGGCAQGAFDSFGQAVIFQARQEGAVARRARFFSVRCGRVGSVVDWPVDNTPCQTHGETWSFQFGRLASR